MTSGSSSFNDFPANQLTIDTEKSRN